ncbi:MAG: 3D-(3,5/4)-trihydroxycyclohexane-1,2-dione acylhydrolase (decyclizing) [Anaerolineae bacterium]|nr:MAG: 3D-(3,5/4)-trihydroxycyclohexane-1,2-dione acylhydrolase (decyclizing) [Anaerolineae bacterium]
MNTVRLTMAQAIIRFLKQQYVERDELERQFFAGCFGIFGHGNVAGIGQALQEQPDFRYYQARNEQAMVHAAAGFAKMSNRLRAFACTSSIGPGATNMVTAAAGATVNRLPVLLLPGDIFARRNVAPVLQQLEWGGSQDVSVNDCFKPISRYWDRINRPEQIITALPEAMRVLTSQAETGAVTLSLPQDVQAEAYDYPEALFEKRVWTIARPAPARELVSRAAEMIQGAASPLIVSGGGVIYSEATEALASFAESAGIPVGETQAGKGSLPYDHPFALGAIGVTGTPGANIIAREADLVIGIGTRYSDFTTASKTAFQNPDVRFININIADFDAHKHSGLALVADARAALEELGHALEGHATDSGYRDRIQKYNVDWEAEVARIYGLQHGPPISQGEVIGAVNAASEPTDVVMCAAGSLPGDLHKLWRTRDPKGYHLEYGYSCMGYEIAGGLGIKMAAPEREVYVMVGDGSYLMMNSEIVTSIQEHFKLTIVLINNHGYSSIGGLSESVGSAGFGTRYRYRNPATGQLDGEKLPVDFAAHARSLGAAVFEAEDLPALVEALEHAKEQDITAVIVIETDPEKRVRGYESWWDVPVAEVSETEEVQDAFEEYRSAVDKERNYL